MSHFENEACRKMHIHRKNYKTRKATGLDIKSGKKIVIIRLNKLDTLFLTEAL